MSLVPARVGVPFSDLIAETTMLPNESSWTATACTRCPHLAACRTQVVVATPSASGGLLAIGEAPGADEDIQGEGFVGTAGKTLDRLLSVHQLKRADYGRANICRCRPPENRKPTGAEMANCLPFLADLLVRTKPRVILAVGGTPTSILCGQGTLHSKLTERNADGDWSAARAIDKAHPLIREALTHVEYIVPTPHTSPLAFNRNSPDGEKWAVVAERQVGLAVRLLQG